MIDELKESPRPKSIADRLREKYMPEDETFDVYLPDFPALKFRVIRDAAEFNTMKAGLVGFSKSVKGGALPPDYAQYATQDDDLIAAVYAMSRACQEEEFTELEFLKLARTAWPVFNLIKEQMEWKQHRLFQIENELQLEEKKSESDKTTGSSSD